MLNQTSQILIKGKVANPTVCLVGDSETAFGVVQVTLNGVTITRDVNGLLTIPKTSHGVIGQPLGYLNNCNDPTYERMGVLDTSNANQLGLQTEVTNSAGTTTTTTNGAVNLQHKPNQRNYWAWLNALCGGGVRCLGNFGQGGDEPQDMSGAMTQAILRNPDLIIFEAGVNSIYANSRSIANTFAQMQALITQSVASGKRVVVLAVPPAFTSYGSWSTARDANGLAVNAMLAALCAANPDRLRYVDINTPLRDPATQAAYSWVTTDGLHWHSRAVYVIAQAIYAAISDWFTFASPLPNTSGDTSVVSRYSKVSNVGPWAATTGGSILTGFTGSAPPGFAWFRGGGTGTGVLSVISDPDGSFWTQCVWTPGGSSDILQLYPQGTSAISLATLGVSATDTLAYGAEVDISGAQASNLSGYQLSCGTNGANGQSLWGNSPTSDVGASTPDAFRAVWITGPNLPNPAVTGFSPIIEWRFSAASASPVTIKVRRCGFLKLMSGQP